MVYLLHNATGQPLQNVEKVIGDWFTRAHGNDTSDNPLKPFDDKNAAWRKVVRGYFFKSKKKVCVSQTEKGVGV
jgi:hypothetical protein